MVGVGAQELKFRVYEITLTDVGYHTKHTYRVVSRTAESAIAASKKLWQSTSQLSMTPAPDAVWVNTGDCVDVIDS